jgi:hypothetical protein
VETVAQAAVLGMLFKVMLKQAATVQAVQQVVVAAADQLVALLSLEQAVVAAELT